MFVITGISLNRISTVPLNALQYSVFCLKKIRTYYEVEEGLNGQNV